MKSEDNTTPEQLTEQEYQWSLDHLDEAIRRLDRVAELVDGTEAGGRGEDDRDINGARARARSFKVYLENSVTPEGSDDE